MTDPSPETLSGHRAEARRLFRHLQSPDPVRARRAAERFARLRSFSPGGPEGVLAARARVRHKHALAVVAEEQGHASWAELVQAHAARPARAPAGPPAPPPFHTPRMESLLNRWFVDPAEARRCLAAEGGYLLPYRGQMFVTEAEGIRALGLDPDDPDWRALGFDLVSPRDPAAFARLCERRRAALAAGIGPGATRDARR